MKFKIICRSLVRRFSRWAWRDELESEANLRKLQQNVVDDAQSLVDAVMRGETADAFCGYGRDGQASNYRDELKWSLHDLKLHHGKVRHDGMRSGNHLGCTT